MFCGNCGKELPEGSNFCSACGWKVGTVGPATAQSAEGTNVLDAITNFDFTNMDKKLVMKLALFAGYIVSFLLFVADWFKAPFVEMFASEGLSFSFLDVVSVCFKTGELFEYMNISLGKVLAQIPSGVKTVAVIFGVLYVINMIWLVVAAVRTIVGKPIFKTQLGALISSLISVVSAFAMVVIFQNAVDEYMGSGMAIGENILAATWQLIVLILVLIALLIAVFYAFKKQDFKAVVDTKADNIFYMLGRFKYIKWVKLGIAVICAILVVVWIVSAIIGMQKHSKDLNYGQIKEDRVDKLSYSYGTYELGEKLDDYYDDFYSSLEFHIDEAHGVFTLWTLEIPEGFDGLGPSPKSESFSIYTSKDIDASLYMVHPNGKFVLCTPIDKNYSTTKLEGVIATPFLGGYDLDYATEAPGEYKVVLVCDHVEDVDFVFTYWGDGYWYNTYYPGQYYDYYQGN